MRSGRDKVVKGPSTGEDDEGYQVARNLSSSKAESTAEKGRAAETRLLAVTYTAEPPLRKKGI